FTHLVAERLFEKVAGCGSISADQGLISKTRDFLISVLFAARAGALLSASRTRWPRQPPSPAGPTRSRTGSSPPIMDAGKHPSEVTSRSGSNRFARLSRKQLRPAIHYAFLEFGARLRGLRELV